jgi:hypothetical protein
MPTNATGETHKFASVGFEAMSRQAENWEDSVLALEGARQITLKENQFNPGHARRLFDHFIRPHEHFRCHRKAERLGGPAADEQFQFSRFLDWKISRFRALEYPLHILCGALQVAGQASRARNIR